MSEHESKQTPFMTAREITVSTLLGGVMLAQMGTVVAAVAEEARPGPSNPETKQNAEIIGAIGFPLGAALFVGGFLGVAARASRQYSDS